MENALDKLYTGLANCGDKSGALDAEGFLICPKCGRRKQIDVTMPLGGGLEKTYRMPIACSCVEEADEIRVKEQTALIIERLKRSALSNPMYYDFSFDKDDRRNAKVSNACRKYVDQWPEMKANNIGILFYGDVGTGKSFMACCIANALIEKLEPAMVTSFPAILRILQNFDDEERKYVYSNLKQASLLVIDDLGAERDTSTALEQVYSVIDSRLLSKKPTIFTTNLDINDVKNPKDMAYKRIYSRVLEMCPIKIDLKGTDRRVEASDARMELARQILGVRNGKT